MHVPLLTSREPRSVRERTDVAGFARAPRAAITGIGLLTPLGRSAIETWDALLAGGYIHSHAAVPVKPEGPYPRVTQLALGAARQAVAHARWGGDILSDPRTALVFGTSKGPIESWINPLPDAIGGSAAFGLSDTARHLATELSLGSGPRLTVSAACATGLHALIRAALLLQSRAADRVLVVASESSLHPLFINSFQRLGVLARDGCRPFDRNRTGFLMSEGAAAICMECEPPACLDQLGDAVALGNDPTGLRPPWLPVTLDNFALGADATHLTGGDREGHTLRHLLRQVVDGRPVDFIHAHGTGTDINDQTELAALESVLSEFRQGAACPLYSHKGALGHSLGAAGLTSVVLNCLIHAAGIVPPNVRTYDPVPMTQVATHNGVIRLPVRRSLAVAAGFGGAAAVISLISQSKAISRL